MRDIAHDLAVLPMRTGQVSAPLYDYQRWFLVDFLRAQSDKIERKVSARFFKKIAQLKIRRRLVRRVRVTPIKNRKRRR